MAVCHLPINPQTAQDEIVTLVAPSGRAETRLTGLIIHNESGAIAVAEFLISGVVVARTEVQPGKTARPLLQINVLGEPLQMRAEGTINVTGEYYVRTDS